MANEHIESLARGFRVLEAFQSPDRVLGLSELARRTGLDKHTVLRMTQTLEVNGLLARDPRSRGWRLTPAVLWLGFTVLHGRDLNVVARPFLLELSRRTGEFVSLAFLDGSDIVMIDTVHAPATSVGVQTFTGYREPAHLSSHGKVLLAELSEEELRALYPDDTLRANTEFGLTAFDDLTAELAKARAAGYAVNNQESSVGVRSVAAPIRARGGAIVASMNLAVPTARVSMRELEERLLPLLSRSAAALSSSLGHELTDPGRPPSRISAADPPGASAGRRATTREPAGRGGAGTVEPAVESLDRGIRLLRCFTAERPSLGLSELSRVTGVNKRVVLRVAGTLESLGYVVQDPDTRSYLPGAQALRLGFCYLESLPFRQVAHPYLRDLARRTGEFVSLSIRDGARTVCLDRVLAAGTRVGVTIQVGHRGWAHLSSHGKMLLTSLTDAEIRALYDGVELSAPTPHTIRDVDRLVEEVRVARDRRFAVNDEESSIGVRSVAAAVHDVDGTLLCTVNIAAPTSRLDRAGLETDLAPAIQHTAGLISAALTRS